MEADYGDVVPRRDYERLKERFQALEKDLKKVRKDQEALMKEHRFVDLFHSTRGKISARQKIITCSRLMKTELNNVVLSTLFISCQKYCSASLNLITQRKPAIFVRALTNCLV